MNFNEEELHRYSRQIILSEIGVEGQERIMHSKVFIVGAGGLGSPVALYLAAAGVGEIAIADMDVVDVSNLQRQVIHHSEDLGREKALSARKKMLAINPNIKVIAHTTAINANNIEELIRGYDFVIDGTDNFAAKFLINDACVKLGISFSHGGILRFGGQSMTIAPRKSACYACLFDAPPPAESVPTCASAGILGSVAGMLGTIQATEALKVIAGFGEPLYDRLLSFDAKSMSFRNINIKRNPKCRVCSKTEIELKDYEAQACEANV
ncbi:HesA/MoeB/ThiF family protein [Campylobacter sp. 19-13652]|uniref:HesA/MoeB/ThiF family protein n=1 Tax=Campylobacter sp. 19-13652 TaxID=2840180 RepID=UPI001C765B4F|nr:HesA/MoeB/ThiF family protein [Campylobacter sp. 19-13652]BCX78562.1 adenylyltransferase [Campylobacter sp. 19-13652]